MYVSDFFLYEAWAYMFLIIIICIITTLCGNLM